MFSRGVNLFWTVLGHMSELKPQLSVSSSGSSSEVSLDEEPTHMEPLRLEDSGVDPDELLSVYPKMYHIIF